MTRNGLPCLRRSLDTRPSHIGVEYLLNDGCEFGKLEGINGCWTWRMRDGCGVSQAANDRQHWQGYHISGIMLALHTSKPWSTLHLQKWPQSLNTLNTLVTRNAPSPPHGLPSPARPFWPCGNFTSYYHRIIKYVHFWHGTFLRDAKSTVACHTFTVTMALLRRRIELCKF